MNETAANGQEVVKTQIPIFQINVNDGRREADQDAVQDLANSITELGLINPITVDQDYTLIAGLHRLEAAKQLGWREIECNVTSLDGLLAELAEIDENVVRKGLSAIEYNDLLLRRKEIYETLHPEIKHGGDRKSEKIKIAKCNLDPPKSFIEDTAEKLGVHPTTVARQIQTAKNLTSETKDIIRESGTKITKKDALKLSQLPPDQQEDAATQLVAGDIRSVDEYHPTPAQSQELAQPESSPASSFPALQPSEGYYPTISDSVADLKNPNKDRRRTPDSFLMAFSYFLQRFCQSMDSYTGPEFDEVLPALTQEHLDLIEERIQLVHDALDELFNKIERMVQK